MKAKIKKFVLPLVIAVMAIAGAFATNLSATSDIAIADRQAYVKVGKACVATAITCSSIFSIQLCTDGANTLYDWNGTSCPMALYQKP